MTTPDLSGYDRTVRSAKVHTANNHPIERAKPITEPEPTPSENVVDWFFVIAAVVSIGLAVYELAKEFA